MHPRGVRPGTGLERDLVLLGLLADAEAAGTPGVGVNRLAEIAGRDKSQVSRAMRRLADVGLVERDRDSRAYRVGWAVFALAARVAESRLLRLAPPEMTALSADLGETVHLCALRGNEVVTLRTDAPDHAFRAVGWIGVGVPIHSTSAGRALLLDATLPELTARFGERRLASGGPRPRVHDALSLHRVIAEARALGHVVVDEEFEAGVSGVSAPIRDFRGAIVAALNVSAPAARLRDRFAEAGGRTRAAADRVSRALGWAGGQVGSGGPT